jgi:hypothetical protein
MIAGFRLCLALVLVLTGLALGWAQQNESQAELSPRDMFRKAVGRLAPESNTAATTPAPAPAPAARRPPTPPAPVARTTPPKPQPDSRTSRPAQVEAVLVSTAREPLGLRYSILKQTEGGGTVEVASDTVFRSGDRIRLTVATTETAYVYVVTKGSSGKWRVLFPSPEISQGSNLIPRGTTYPIPAAHWFAFNDQVGEESLFILVSRRPEKDLDALIYQLKESGTDPAPPGGPVLMAQNVPPVEDALISRLRGEVIARDLVFEKVDDSGATASADVVRPERAVYVVNKTGADDSRVIADIKLQHR